MPKSKPAQETETWTSWEYKCYKCGNHFTLKSKATKYPPKVDEQCDACGSRDIEARAGTDFEVRITKKKLPRRLRR